MFEPQDWYDHQEQALFDAYERGEMTDRELREAQRDLAFEYREDRERAAEEAAERERERW